MTRMVTASANAQLDQMLEDACEGLQLTETQLAEAEGHYRAVGSWLAGVGSPLRRFAPDVRPQGSILQGTVVKPIGRDEFDIDLVCVLRAGSPSRASAAAVYELVARRLESSGRYKDKLRRDARCLTLEYAGDFNLDILPALPSSVPAPGSIWIPDRRLDRWIPSNPFGFAEWFRQETLRQRAEQYAAALAKGRDVQPLPTTDIAARPLQRAVQLIKRRRDIVFGTAEDRPSSMALTTIAGSHYEGDWPTSDALICVLAGIHRDLETAPIGTLSVPNPSDPDEDLVSEWTFEQHHAFIGFISEFVQKLRELLRVRGMVHLKKALSDLFGESVAEDVLRRHAQRLETDRQSGKLGIGRSPVILTGAAATSAAHTIPRNTFFGS